MFKKLLCFIIAVMMIMFLWMENGNMKSYGLSLKNEVFMYRNSSSGVMEKNEKDIYLFKKGESIVLYEQKDVDDLIEFYNAELKITERTENGINYYLYTKETKYVKEVNGEIISLHIYIDSEKTVIGTPIIFGSI